MALDRRTKLSTKYKRDWKGWFQNHLPAPDKLWELAVDYFEEQDSSKMMETRPMSTKEGVEMVSVPHMRVYTTTGLCNFLGITDRTWRNYRDREEYQEVCQMIEQIIWQNKFEGAAANFINPSLIGKSLGIAEQVELSGPGGKPIEHRNVRNESDEFARRMAGLAASSPGAGDGEAEPEGEG